MTLPTMANMSNAAPQPGQQVVAILAVDTVNMVAQGQSRQGSVSISIDLRYHVNAIHVMPAVGEQWTIKRFSTAWVLVSKLPQNTAELLTTPVEGQVQIGSTGSTQGPLHLNGSQVTVNAPLAVQTTTATTRPDPALYPPGTHIYDTDLGRPIWSNGTDWHDATGKTFYTADCSLELIASAPATLHWGAHANADLTITASGEGLVQQGAHAEASLAVTAESDSDMQAGRHFFGTANQVIVASSLTEAHHEALADAEQTITVQSLFTASRGQGMDATRNVEFQFGAAGEKTFDAEQTVTAAPTGGMTQEMGADVLDGFVYAGTTAEMAHSFTVDADLEVTADSGADVPKDITAESWQMIQASRTAGMESPGQDLQADAHGVVTAAPTAELVKATTADAELEVTAEPDAGPSGTITADAWQMIQANRTGEVE